MAMGTAPNTTADHAPKHTNANNRNLAALLISLQPPFFFFSWFFVFLLPSF